MSKNKISVLSVIEGMLTGSLARKRPDPTKVLAVILAYEGQAYGDLHVWRYIVVVEDGPPISSSIDVSKNKVRLSSDDIINYTQVFQQAIKQVAGGGSWVPCYNTQESMDRAQERLQQFIGD